LDAWNAGETCYISFVFFMHPQKKRWNYYSINKGKWKANTPNTDPLSMTRGASTKKSNFWYYEKSNLLYFPNSVCVVKSFYFLTIPKKWARRHGGRDRSDEGGWEGHRHVYRCDWNCRPRFLRWVTKAFLSGYLVVFRVCVHTFICVHETWKRWVIRDTILIQECTHDSWTSVREDSRNSYELIWTCVSTQGTKWDLRRKTLFWTRHTTSAMSFWTLVVTSDLHHRPPFLRTGKFWSQTIHQHPKTWSQDSGHLTKLTKLQEV